MWTDVIIGVLVGVQAGLEGWQLEQAITGQTWAAQVGGEMEAIGTKGNAGMGLLAKAAIAAGVGVTPLGAAVTAYSIKAAADFNHATLAVANNTGMTNKQLESMRAEILKLGSEAPVALSELALGFEKAANAGYHGREAMDIVTASMKAAVETGGTRCWAITCPGSGPSALARLSRPSR